MTVIEKLGYDKDALARQFEAWCHGPGMVSSDCDRSTDYDSLRHRYAERRYETFLDWAYSEFVELVPGIVCRDGSIYIGDAKDDPMKVVVLNVFDTGWKYHLNRLKERKQDVSRPFAGYDKSAFRQALHPVYTAEDRKELRDRIWRQLNEHDKSNPNCIVYCGLQPGDRVFYEKYDECLSVVAHVIGRGENVVPVDYIKSLVRRDGK